MKIFVAGSWHKSKIKKIKKDIKITGKLIAENKHTLITGGGTGVSEIVANSYLEFGGKNCIVYDVAPRFRKKVGEEKKVKAHQVIKTNKDYPNRNNIMVESCDLMIAFNGKLGVLGEILNAVNDYHKKVIIFEKGFEKIGYIKEILSDVKNNKIIYTNNINKSLINSK